MLVFLFSFTVRNETLASFFKHPEKQMFVGLSVVFASLDCVERVDGG